jgi:hypothetical protein
LKKGKFTMTRTLVFLTVAAVLLCVGVGGVLAAGLGDFPEPSPYPISWDLKFEHGAPKRILVSVPGQAPQAYWYMTYRVTNDTGQEQLFLPVFELLTSDGKVHPSDRGISPRVFDAIKDREGNRMLERHTKVEGTLRQGEAQARDSVAIWKQPMDQMGQFTVFVSGLSGEANTYRMENGNLVKIDPAKRAEETKDVPKEQLITLRKTLKLDYAILGDERVTPNPEPQEKSKSWVMR